MKSRKVYLVGGAVLAAAIVAVFSLSGKKDPAGAPASGQVQGETKADQKRPRTELAGGGESAGGKEAGLAGAEVPAGNEGGGKLTPEQRAAADKARQPMLDALDEAATTYDPAQLPVINKYLYHKDPVVRKAAMDAMLVLGDSGAGKYLRDAADAALSIEEKKAMLNAAEYAELPPVDLKAQALRKKSTNTVHDQHDIRKNGGLTTTRRNAAANAGGTAAPAPAPTPAPTPGQ